MPAYLDEERKTWYCKFYHTDWKGIRKTKMKRGFRTKKEAIAWERSFLENQQINLDIEFRQFIEIYKEDMSTRLRESTMTNKNYIIVDKLIPYFGKKPMNAIKASDVRKWQNQLIQEGFAPTYLKTINNQLSAIFNYAVRYYELQNNPCRKAGSIGKGRAEEMLFWTRTEFDKFVQAIRDKPQSYTAFFILYWTGMRIGELMALTMEDIDLYKETIRINKSYQRLNEKDLITEPKTPKSNRTISIPETLKSCIEDYLGRLYGLDDNARIFPFTKSFLTHEMIRGCSLSGVKKIRLHDLRHSHASLLIELGFSPVAIAERLGHEKVETTLNTYSHLYPNKQMELAKRLDEEMQGGESQ